MALWERIRILVYVYEGLYKQDMHPNLRTVNILLILVIMIVMSLRSIVTTNNVAPWLLLSHG